MHARATLALRRAADGHGVSAEVAPEVFLLDDWGYPIVTGAIDDRDVAHARAAVSACPHLALRLVGS